MKLTKVGIVRIVVVSVAVIALLTITLAGVFINGNNSAGGGETQNALERIEITKPPKKTEYFVGETFSRSGMVVTAFYTDKTEKKIMNYKIDKTDALQLSDNEVTVTFKDKTAKQKITVTEKVIPTLVTVKSAEHNVYKVEAENLVFNSEELGTDKTQYFEYHDGSQGNPQTSGGVSVGRLNYSGEAMYFRITSEVEADAYVTLSMAFNPSLDFDDSVETIWNGETIETGFNVAVSGGAKYVWFDWNEYVIKGLKLKKGFNELTLKLKDTSKLSPNYDYLKLEVTPIDIENVTGIEITAQPDKVRYTEGEAFDDTGMIVSAVMKDGTKIRVYDYEIDKTTLKTDDTQVTIGYRNTYTATVGIEVSRAAISGLRIVSNPERTEYYVGQKFETKGLVVYADTAAGSSFDATALLTFDRTVMQKGDTKVVASYDGKTVDIPVTMLSATTFTVDASFTSEKVEAEDAVWVSALGKSKQIYQVVDDAKASGNKRLDSCDWMKGSSFMVMIESEVETDIVIKVCCDGPGLDFGNIVNMTFNGATVKLSENPSGGWVNFKPYAIDSTVRLKKGLNVFVLNFNDDQMVNFDYFEFVKAE